MFSKPSRALGRQKLDHVFNYYAYRLKTLDLVLVSNLTLKKNYGVDIVSHGYCVGIVLSGPIERDPPKTSIEGRSMNIYYEKMYNVLICDKIILLKIKDIQEKLT